MTNGFTALRTIFRSHSATVPLHFPQIFSLHGGRYHTASQGQDALGTAGLPAAGTKPLLGVLCATWSCR